ncbi:RXT2-like, N-terminal domain containing protein [Naviculisporaceae sp. PSN 640]
MATQQQVVYLEALAAIKKALKRKAYESDSDSSIEQNTNRGNKLKRKARFVSHGRIGPSLDSAAYKEIGELAGHHRAIIHQNPPLVDEDGYDLDSDDNEELASALEDNPYASIHLEQLLAPLTAVTDLPTHPTLSRPFTSKALTELVDQARILMQKENAALWKVKPLLTKLVGDNTWAPCGMMIEENDHELFTETARFLIPPRAMPNGRTLGESSLRETIVEAHTETAPGLVDAQGKGKEKEPTDGELIPVLEGRATDESETDPPAAPEKGEPQVNGNTETEVDPSAVDVLKQETNGTGDVEMAEAPPDGCTTQLQQLESNTATKANDVAHASQLFSGGIPASLELLERQFIHPLFLPPRAAHPDRDIGLPEQEADDVRRILQLYVQKQEEVCRGTKKLYEGLLKADRLRKTVLQWSKAEAHCGPNRDMSDGEDWYDKEEWGITEDLKKGEDEVEEDTAQTQKKTRNRK